MNRAQQRVVREQMAARIEKQWDQLRSNLELAMSQRMVSTAQSVYIEIRCREMDETMKNTTELMRA